MDEWVSGETDYANTWCNADNPFQDRARNNTELWHRHRLRRPGLYLTKQQEQNFVCYALSRTLRHAYGLERQRQTNDPTWCRILVHRCRRSRK